MPEIIHRWHRWLVATALAAGLVAIENERIQQEEKTMADESMGQKVGGAIASAAKTVETSASIAALKQVNKQENWFKANAKPVIVGFVIGVLATLVGVWLKSHL